MINKIINQEELIGIIVGKCDVNHNIIDTGYKHNLLTNDNTRSNLHVYSGITSSNKPIKGAILFVPLNSNFNKYCLDLFHDKIFDRSNLTKRIKVTIK